jgi:toxin-antitoxin system PIN domain toxin
MILVDANLLIYAVVEEAPEHEAAVAWLDERMSGTARVGLPWPSLLAFVRVVANPRAVERPLSLPEAWRRVRAWLAQPPAWVPPPTERHADVLEGLLLPERAPRLVPDAHLAALAIEHGLVLCSADRDFSRFAGLRWENPLSR